MILPRVDLPLPLGALLLLGACSSPSPPVPESPAKTEASSLTLSLRQPEAGAAAFELSLRNDGPEAFTVVRPRPDRLQRYESWGGWTVGVAASTRAALSLKVQATPTKPTAQSGR